MKKIALSIIFILLGYVFAQNSNPVFDSQPTIVETIQRGRNILLENFLTGNIEKADEMFLYLNGKVANSDYAAFTPYETVVLSVWLQHYDIALKEITYLDSIGNIKNRQTVTQQIYPKGDDGLSMKLTEKYSGFKPVSFISIENTPDLKSEEKEALMLILDDIFLYSEQQNPDVQKSDVQEELNERSHLFLNTYPDSKYAGYIRKNVLFELKKSDWGYTFDFWGGYAVLSGNMSDYFTNSGIFGCAFSVMYKKCILFLDTDLTFPKLKKNIYFDNTVWAKGSSTSSGHVALQAGYSIIEKKYLVITPFAGIGYMGFEPNTYNIKNYPDLKRIDIGSFALAAGINADIIIKDLSHTGGNLPVRLRVSYIKPTNLSPQYQGSMLAITLGLSIQSRNIVRKY